MKKLLISFGGKKFLMVGILGSALLFALFLSNIPSKAHACNINSSPQNPAEDAWMGLGNKTIASPSFAPNSVDTSTVFTGFEGSKANLIVNDCVSAACTETITYASAMGASPTSWWVVDSTGGTVIPSSTAFTNQTQVQLPVNGKCQGGQVVNGVSQGGSNLNDSVAGYNQFSIPIDTSAWGNGKYVLYVDYGHANTLSDEVDQYPFTVQHAAPTSSGMGTITVTSENSQNTNIAVPATWNFPEFPLAQDNPCSGHGGSCDNQTNSTYSNLDTGPYQLCSVFDPKYCHPAEAGLYSLNSVKEVPIASRPSNLFTAIANFGKGIISPDALAVSSCGQLGTTPPSGCSLPSTSWNLPSGGQISYVILWDPIANIAVNSSTAASISLNAASGSSATGQVQVSNDGVTGSTLTWSASSDSSWLSASPSSDSSGLTNTAQGVSAAEGIIITADASGLSAGPHTGTITFAGTSTPGTSIAHLLATLTVTFTVGGGSNCQNGVCSYFACGSGVCEATSSPSGGSNCSNACGGTGNGSSLTATCTPSTVTLSPLETSQCVLDLNGIAQNGSWSMAPGSTGSIDAASGVYTPSSAGTETVVGTNIDGTSANATIVVTAGGSSLPTCKPGVNCPSCDPGLTATPSTIVVPDSSNLSYTCHNVNLCQISGAATGQFSQPTNVPTSGNVSTTPSITTTYTLACTNTADAPGGNNSAGGSATVTVNGSSYCEQNPNGVGCQ